jgi:hypothetical protein
MYIFGHSKNCLYLKEQNKRGNQKIADRAPLGSGVSAPSGWSRGFFSCALKECLQWDRSCDLAFRDPFPAPLMLPHELWHVVCNVCSQVLLIALHCYARCAHFQPEVQL